MENDKASGSRGALPTPDEARTALGEAEKAQAAVAAVSPPLWYFLAIGALVALLAPGVAVLPASPLALIAVPVIALWAAVLALLTRAVANRMGIVARWDWRRAWPAVTFVGVLLVAGVVLTFGFGQRWALPASFVAEGILIVCFGILQARRARNGVA